MITLHFKEFKIKESQDRWVYYWLDGWPTGKVKMCTIQDLDEIGKIAYLLDIKMVKS